MKYVIRKTIFIIGVIWGVLAWALWPLTPNRGYMSALWCALIIAPAYLFVAVQRVRGYPARIFIVTALGILTLVGVKIVPASGDLTWIYIVVPPSTALLAYLFLSLHA
jgi:hypothetical protein